MELLTSKVPRALEAKTKLFGFELGDLLLIFLYLALSNLVFGGTPLKLPLVWGVTAVLAATLFFVKRGKPDQYLQDLTQYWLTPGVWSAGAPDLRYTPLWPDAQGKGNRHE